MKTNIVIYSEELTKDDIQLLLQIIQDCEHDSFLGKKIGVYIFVTEMNIEEIQAIIDNIQPPFEIVESFKGVAIKSREAGRERAS